MILQYYVIIIICTIIQFNFKIYTSSTYIITEVIDSQCISQLNNHVQKHHVGISWLDMSQVGGVCDQVEAC